MGLAGIPGMCSRLICVVYDRFEIVVVYLNDISKTNEEHTTHQCELFKMLRHEIYTPTEASDHSAST